MAGRRRGGTFGPTVSALVLQDRERRLSREDEATKFRQRLTELGITKGFLSPTFNPQGELTGLGPGPMAPPQAFMPQARQQLQTQLPQTPFVSGPEGGFITGSQVEALPGATVPRPQVVESLAGQLAPQLQVQARMTQPGMMQPVYERTREGQLRRVGDVPKGSRILSMPKAFDEAFSAEQPAWPGVGQTESPAALLRQPGAGGGGDADPIVKTGVDDAGRRVGKTRSGRVVYLDEQ